MGSNLIIIICTAIWLQITYTITDRSVYTKFSPTQIHGIKDSFVMFGFSSIIVNINLRGC